MLVESILLTLVIAAWRKAGQKGQWNPKREEMFQAAMNKLRDPEKLIKLADLLEKDGHHAKAYVMRKRAALRKQTDAQKAQRKEAYEKGMKSEKIDAILALAKAFEDLTATGAAKNLRERATYLRNRNADLEVQQWKKYNEKREASQAKEEPPTVPDKPSTIPAPAPPEEPAPITEDELENPPEETESASSSPNGVAHA